MRKVILFKKGIETLEFFSKQMGTAFEQMGLEVFFYDLEEEEQSRLEMEHFVEKGEVFAIGFNFNGIRGEEGLYDGNGNLFWKVKRIPFVNIMVDHPFYYVQSLEKVRKELGWELYYQISIDLDHEKYMKRFFPEIHKVCFMPLAGTSLGYPFNRKKEYDVVMVGNYKSPSHFRKYIERIDEEYAAFYYEIIQYLIENPQTTMEDAFERFLLREMPDLTDGELVKCMENMIFIDLYVRFYYRGEVIKQLVDSGIHVHVFGSGWESLDIKEKELLHIGGATDSKGCLEAMRKARIALNIMPWFKEGAHDRIFNGMLNGALVVTDESGYLCRELSEQQVIFYSLSHVEELPHKVKKFLGHQEEIDRRVQGAYQFARGKHTWKERARFIYEWINS